MGSKTGVRESSWRLLQQFRQEWLVAWTAVVVVGMERKKKINICEEPTHNERVQ